MKQLSAVLVLPYLNIQNANAISSPQTHGFPSITAFTGLMWALERNLSQQGIALGMHGIGIVCHHHQEHATQGFVRNFKLSRSPLNKHGQPSPIIEKGRMHLQVTLVIGISEKAVCERTASLRKTSPTQLSDWAQAAGRTLAGMRLAGGSVLPPRPAPGKRTQPWMAVVPQDAREAAAAFRRWRRHWIPGYALVGRDDLLPQRLEHLKALDPAATLVDAWLHASRINLRPQPGADGTLPPDGKATWSDRLRPTDDSWLVPIPVGYASIAGRPFQNGEVRNARDATKPFDFVESVYSIGQWVSPLHLNSVTDLIWQPEHNQALGLYRCRNQYECLAAPTPDVSPRRGEQTSNEKHPNNFAVVSRKLAMPA